MPSVSFEIRNFAKRIIVILLSACVLLTAFDANAARRKKRRKKISRPKITKVVMQTPTTSGPLDETERFITFETETPITKGLDNRIIALWQSHGKYYDQTKQYWRWQRPRLFSTVEDLFSQGFVMPYLMPMLENAGAYVMSPRERDINTNEIIIDTDGWDAGDFYLKNGRRHWKETPVGTGFANRGETLTDGMNPFTAGTSEVVETVYPDDEGKESTANWTANVPERGRYAVYVSFRTYPNSATDAHYTINHLGGSTNVTINQRMGGGTWIYLGHYELAKGKPSKPIVMLSNISEDDDAVVSADAVKLGGGMGNIARTASSVKQGQEIRPITSGGPRFTEGARYWLQWAGMPYSVYSESKGENDYTDDYKSRALWVNYLAGGSPMLPDSVGLNIPIDMALAFHTDAGKRDDGTIVGTLGIYSTDDGNLLGDGRSRYDNRDLTQDVIQQVVSDIRSLHDTEWTNRGVFDKKYYEIRETKVPAMIIELLSHQNFTDMKFGLDPAFRFDVARAVYKGILRFLSRRYNTEYIVQPLPISKFAIHATTKGKYRLSWASTKDPLEPSAQATYFVVQERIENGAFRDVAIVEDTYYDTTIEDDRIHSYRIIAGNDGGRSFASEILALRNNKNLAPQVNIVNGFTRISAPDCFEDGNLCGFDYCSDAGVADIADIITTGVQYDYRTDSDFLDNDIPGFGASHGNYEKIVTAGNTHDFVYIHGVALRAAGYGFVSESADAFCSNTTLPAVGSPSNPATVDLILGKQKEISPGRGTRGSKYKALKSDLQHRLEAHCNQGGTLFVSGAYIASDLLNNSYSDEATLFTDKNFANTLLGIDWQPGKGSIDGMISMVPSPFKPFDWDSHLSFSISPSPDCYAVESPDAIRPAQPGAATIMRYDETGLAAAVAFDRVNENTPGKLTASRIVSMGFPFETIQNEKARNRLMSDIMHFLSPRK